MNTSKMYYEHLEEKEEYKYFRTTCGILSFILFFLGTFLAFVIAGESDDYFEYLMILGFALLFATLLLFCCLLHESKRVIYSEAQISELLRLQPRGFHSLDESPDYQSIQSESERELPLPPRPESELYVQPHTETESNFYETIGSSSRHSGEVTNYENDSDSNTQASLESAKSGSQTGSQEKSIESQVETAKCKEASDIELHSLKAGPSNVSGKSSEVTESKLEDPPVQAMSALSISDSSKSPNRSKVKSTEV